MKKKKRQRQAVYALVVSNLTELLFAFSLSRLPFARHAEIGSNLFLSVCRSESEKCNVLVLALKRNPIRFPHFFFLRPPMKHIRNARLLLVVVVVVVVVGVVYVLLLC
jgi:hypothetical protein